MTERIRRAVRIALVEREMTQRELAERAEVTEGHLTRMLRGVNGNINPAWQRVLDELDLELTVKAKGE